MRHVRERLTWRLAADDGCCPPIVDVRAFHEAFPRTDVGRAPSARRVCPLDPWRDPASRRRLDRAGGTGAEPVTTPDRGRRRSALPAAVLVTTRDRLVKPHKQRALATALRADRSRNRRAITSARGRHPVSSRRSTVELVACRRNAVDIVDGLIVADQPLDLPGQPLDPLGEVVEALVDVLAGDHVGHRDTHAGDLAGEELGVGLGPFGDVTVVLCGDPVASFLAGLGEQDQRCCVRRLDRQHEGEQHQAAAPRVELDAFGDDRVERRSRR